MQEPPPRNRAARRRALTSACLRRTRTKAEIRRRLFIAASEVCTGVCTPRASAAPPAPPDPLNHANLAQPGGFVWAILGSNERRCLAARGRGVPEVDAGRRVFLVGPNDVRPMPGVTFRPSIFLCAPSAPAMPGNADSQGPSFITSRYQPGRRERPFCEPWRDALRNLTGSKAVSLLPGSGRRRYVTRSGLWSRGFDPRRPRRSSSYPHQKLNASEASAGGLGVANPQRGSRRA